MGKLVSAVVGVCLALSAAAMASQPAGDGYAEVALGSVRVESSYKASDVHVRYREDRSTNTVVGEVVDRETGRILESLSETLGVPATDASNAANGGSETGEQSFDTSLTRAVTLEDPNGQPIQASVWVKMNVTVDATGTHINRVDACGHQSSDAGAYTLEVANTAVRTAQFPCDAVSVQINGVIELTSESSPAISYSALQSRGFSMTGTAGSSWSASKPYSRIVSFALA